MKDGDELEDYAGEEMDTNMDEEETAREQEETTRDEKENTREEKENTREEKENTREKKENTKEEKENTRKEKENTREEKENTWEDKDDMRDVWSLEDWQDCCSGSQVTDTTSLVEQVVGEEHMMDPPDKIVNRVEEIGEEYSTIEEKDKEKEEKDQIQIEKDKINEEKDKTQEEMDKEQMEKDKLQEEKDMCFDVIVTVDEQENPDDWEDKRAEKQEVTGKLDKELCDVNIEMVALSKLKNDKNLQDTLEEVVVIADEKTKTLVLDKNSERLMIFFRAQVWPLLAKIGSMLCAWLFLLVVLWAFGSLG